jgi:HK97 family phage portal protein
MSWIGRLNPWGRKEAGLSISTVIARIEALQQAASGITVTPENCLMSPTVNAIIGQVTKRMATLPVHVYETSESNGRATRKRLRSHWLEKLLRAPNDWTDSSTWTLDGVSQFLRYGNFVSVIGRGVTGPPRQLWMQNAGNVRPKIDHAEKRLRYEVTEPNGAKQTYELHEVLHVRGASRDGIWGESPVEWCKEAIALEIAAERMAGATFGNGAQPGLVFEFDGVGGFKTDEQRDKFVADFTAATSGKKRFTSMLLPKGIKVGSQVAIEYDKLQLIASRQYQRTVICGAFGAPPHLAGDLSKMTYGNSEQVALDLVQGMILPIVKAYESAIERQLLTPADRNAGIVVRFNLDAALRGDFKSRQEGLAIQRDRGIINPNDWREHENLNPIAAADGGETYWQNGPSGQGKDQAKPKDEPPRDDAEDEDEDEATKRGPAYHAH